LIGQPILAADGQQKIDPQRHDGFLDCGPWLLVGGQSLIESALYCVDQPLVAKFKISKKKIPAPAWRLKSRRNKKRDLQTSSVIYFVISLRLILQM